jgi:Ca2+-binding RTX toxin-like protein
MPPDSQFNPAAGSMGGLAPATLGAPDPYPLQETSLAGGFSGPEFFLNADSRTGIADNGKSSLTIDEAASQIVRGEPGWSGALGVGATVTYAYRADAPTVMPDTAGGFQEFTAAQIAQTELALKAWSDVADIHFVRVGSGASGPAAYSDNATCDGGNGDDQVRGGQGDDSVSGGAGNDFISGDRGADTESGGAGADIFHTSQDAGIDKVLDFHLAEGDRVMLDPGTTFTVSQVGADTVIDMGGGNEMILVGVQMSTLTPGWIFGA